MEPQDLDSKVLRLFKNKNPFRVPESYFVNVYTQIHAAINEVAVPSVLQDKDSEVFSTPLAYFNELGDRIMDRIDEDNLSQIGISTSNPFQVPEKYFEKLTDRTLEKVQSTTSKTVRIHFQQIVKYAVAACLVCALTFMIFKFTGKDSQMSQDLFANISEDELLAFVQEHATEYDLNSLSGLLSEEEIEALGPEQEIDENEIDELIEEYL